MFKSLALLPILATALAGVTVFGTPTPAQAAGATAFVYSPIGCRTFEGQLWIYPSGQISNRSTSEPMRVFCPLIHESKFNKTDRFQISVVQANQTHRDGNDQVMRVKCRVFFNHPHATEDPRWTQTAWHGQSANAIGVTTATITVPGDTHHGGSHMLECIIPPRDLQGANQALYRGESRIGTYKSGVD